MSATNERLLSVGGSCTDLPAGRVEIVIYMCLTKARRTIQVETALSHNDKVSELKQRFMLM